jgi:G:T-mismatch repair DNA endonuclease (very short patch repair protein)
MTERGQAMKYDERLDRVIDKYVKVFIHGIWIRGHVRRLDLPAHNRILYQLETCTGFVELDPAEVKKVEWA